MDDNYSFELLSQDVCLYSCAVQDKAYMLGWLMPILLRSSFFSVTQSDTECSFIFDADHRKEIPVKQLQKIMCLSSIEQTFRVLKVYQTNHQVNEQGIVAHFATQFNQLEVPILYINSFANNYILIPTDRLDDVVQHFCISPSPSQ